MVQSYKPSYYLSNIILLKCTRSTVSHFLFSLIFLFFSSLSFPHLCRPLEKIMRCKCFCYTEKNSKKKIGLDNLTNIRMLEQKLFKPK